MKKTTIAILILVVIPLIIIAVIFQTRGKQAGDSVSSAPPRDPAAASDAPGVRKNRGGTREADRMLKAEGVLTDVSLSEFPAKEYQHLSPPAGKAAGAPAGEAYIHVPSAGRRVAMEPNQLGEFPSIPTNVNDTVGVRLTLDAAKPGTPVRVVILDGGSFPTATGASRVLTAEEWHGVAFEYTTSGNVGTHRVLVQAVGQPSRIFDFSAYDAKTGWPAPSLSASN
jgi:hypothetical protein